MRWPDCGVRVEGVTWASAGARHTRDFEDVVAFLAQQMVRRMGADAIGERIAVRVLWGGRELALALTPAELAS